MSIKDWSCEARPKQTIPEPISGLKDKGKGFPKGYKPFGRRVREDEVLPYGRGRLLT